MGNKFTAMLRLTPNQQAKWSDDQERGEDFFQSLTAWEVIVSDHISQSGEPVSDGIRVSVQVDAVHDVGGKAKDGKGKKSKSKGKKGKGKSKHEKSSESGKDGQGKSSSSTSCSFFDVDPARRCPRQLPSDVLAVGDHERVSFQWRVTQPWTANAHFSHSSGELNAPVSVHIYRAPEKPF